MQKYWSGIVTCYTAITIDYLDLTNVSGMLILIKLCKKKRFFGGGLCRNITVPSYCIAAILCRASFRVCAEILVFGRNIHLWIMIMICLIKIIIMVYYYPDDCHDKDTLVPALPSSPADLPRECLPIRYWHRCYGFQHGSWLW